MTAVQERPAAVVAPAGWRSAAAGALPVWLGSRAALVLLSVVGTWLLAPGTGRDRPSLVEQWQHWDVDLFRKVAEFGYFSPAYGDHAEAFFPGMPAALRAVHWLVPSWTGAGLLVSLVAGAVASVFLWRLAEQESGPEAARRAVLYLVLFPYAVFLFAGYSEALFLAFATSAWWAARNDRWLLAGLLGAGATLTRITGVVLAMALLVQYVDQAVRARPAGGSRLQAVVRPRVLWLGLTAVPLVGYFAYLHAETGHWDAYRRALLAGWGRDTVSPVAALRTTLAQAGNHDQGAAYLWSWRAELAAMAIGVLLTVVLVRQRRWGEAAYVGLNVALLSTSTYYASGVRALLVWFPAYLLLARTSLRVRWLHEASLWVLAPVMFGVALAFTRGSWLG